MVGVLLVAVLAGAAIFAFLNGFRDASTAVALSVRTRALTPAIAVLLAALFNLAGAWLGAGFVAFIQDRLVNVPGGRDGLLLLLGALVAACLWGVQQWWRGYPSSSTHALIGGLVGASIAASILGRPALGDATGALVALVVLPLVLSPVIAYLVSFLAVYPALWAARHTAPHHVNRATRQIQSVATAVVAFGHGLQDGQRTSAVVLFALAAAGVAGAGDGDMPPWVPAFTAVLLAVGTLFGGWRISYTLGHRLARVDPMRGFVAQLVAALLLFVGAIGLHLPLSTTHTVTAGVVGAGQNQQAAAVRGRLLLRIVGAWLATPLACAVLGGIFFLALSPLA